MTHLPHLRVARPTDDLEAAVAFYHDGLGFEVLSRFDDHDGYDGVMLGLRGAGYHLELTRQRGHRAGRAPSPEHLLVLYLPEQAAWEQAVTRMEAAGHRPAPATNPYWDRGGRTYEDPDGYRIVLYHGAWPPVGAG